MSNLIPNDAEPFDSAMYHKTVGRPSVVIPGAERRVWVLTCPACQATHESPPFLRTITCHCGLSMQLTGVMIHVWRADAPTTTA